MTIWIQVLLRKEPQKAFRKVVPKAQQLTMLGLASLNTDSHCSRLAGSLSAGAIRMASNQTICLSAFSASNSYRPSADWMPSNPSASPSRIWSDEATLSVLMPMLTLAISRVSADKVAVG